MTSGGLHSTVKTKQAKSGYVTSENNKSYEKKYERIIDQMTRKVVYHYIEKDLLSHKKFTVNGY